MLKIMLIGLIKKVVRVVVGLERELQSGEVGMLKDVLMNVHIQIVVVEMKHILYMSDRIRLV